MKYRGRLVVDPEVMHGNPVIKGTCIPVDIILSLLAAGYGFDLVLKDYPDLCKEDMLACLEYAAGLSQDEVDILGVEVVN